MLTEVTKKRLYHHSLVIVLVKRELNGYELIIADEFLKNLECS